MRILRRGGYLSERPALKSLPVRPDKPTRARPRPVSLRTMTEGNAGSVVALDRPQAPEWRRHVALVLGVVLVFGWLVWAVLTWQAQLRYVTIEDFKSDVADGQVTSYLIVSNVRPTRTWPAMGTADLWDLPALDDAGHIERIPGNAPAALMYLHRPSCRSGAGPGPGEVQRLHRDVRPGAPGERGAHHPGG